MFQQVSFDAYSNSYYVTNFRTKTTRFMCKNTFLFQTHQLTVYSLTVLANLLIKDIQA